MMAMPMCNYGYQEHYKAIAILGLHHSTTHRQDAVGDNRLRSRERKEKERKGRVFI